MSRDTTAPQAQRCLEWLERKTFHWMTTAHEDPSALDAETHVIEDTHRLVTRMREQAAEDATVDPATADRLVNALLTDEG